MNWGLEDVFAAAALVSGAAVLYWLGSRATASRAFRAAIGIAIAAGFLLIWAHLAVGIF